MVLRFLISFGQLGKTSRRVFQSVISNFVSNNDVQKPKESSEIILAEVISFFSDNIFVLAFEILSI